jgi:hypothetical protein
MRHAPRLTALLSAAALAGLGLAATGSAEANKVRLCHGTASDTNPYVLVVVDDNALAGHFDGADPGHGWQNAPDVLLADGETECPGGEPEPS